MPRPEPTRPQVAFLFLVSVLSGLGGCRERDIRTYRTPKETGDDALPTQPSGQATAGEATAPQWQAPAGWQAQPATGMRLASFLASDGKGGTADISVVSFGGSGGDELANVNRWRNQLKLAPVTAEAMAAQLQNLAAPAGSFSIADLTAEESEGGRPPARILGAWLRRDERVWFFKMMGPAELVGSQKASFMDFLKSVAFASPAPESPGTMAARGPASLNTNDLPRTAPEVPDLGAAPSGPSLPGMGQLKAAEGSSLRWEAPPSWAVRPAGTVRRGSYSLGPDGRVDLAITAFPGDVGGPLANVNRWLGQVGLPPVGENGLGQITSHLEANGLDVFVADTGAKDSSRPQRIVAGVVSWQGNTWFFKLTGPGELVAREKPGFLEFLHTVRPP